MNSINHLLLAHQQAKSAAAHHQNMATQCAAMAGLLDAMRKASDQPHPIVDLAQALLPMGLCILHKDAVKNALTVVETTTDTDGLSSEALLELERSLNAALTGR
jgi:hypothetical protein